jgi:hypothetical protein
VREPAGCGAGRRVEPGGATQNGDTYPPQRAQPPVHSLRAAPRAGAHCRSGSGRRIKSWRELSVAPNHTRSLIRPLATLRTAPGCYETAWTGLHKLRAAPVRPEREPLGPFMQMDEALVGRKTARTRSGYWWRRSPTAECASPTPNQR